MPGPFASILRGVVVFAARLAAVAALVGLSAPVSIKRVAAQNAPIPARPPATLPLPLVHLRDIDPSIAQDMRYAGYDNFTGAPVPGYSAAECIVTRRTAKALSAVQRELAGRGFSLKVYDCYRPLRAVAAFMQWTAASHSDATTVRFHPGLARTQLVPLGYIASRSGHSRGHVVDLTLVVRPRPGVPASEPAFERGRIYGACTSSADTRAPDDSLDMGTGFDCFDVRSHAGSSAITATQAANRQSLLEAMRQAGFVPYDREWWHFSFAAGDPGQSFDIDIQPRR